MAIPFKDFPENPLNLKKINKNPKNQNMEKLKNTNPNLKSFWAFLSSIFIYIYVFYIFDLSPSTVICTTKFWFFISNTLVLIVAVDFAAFSSAKRRDSRDDTHVIKYTSTTSSKSNIVIPSYEEHMIKDTTATSAKCDIIIPSYEEHTVKGTTATSSKGGPIVPFNETTWHEKKRAKCARSNSENVVVPFTWHDFRGEENPKERIVTVVYDHHEKKREKCAAAEEEEEEEEEEGKALVLHRTFSERHDCEDHGIWEDDKINEFSRMSNEEVNRRVEEFIQRFNRQIRLQAVMNRRNLEMNKIH